MYTGDRVKLKYWDGTKFVNEFPAGVSIAWFLIESSYNQGTKEIMNNKRTFYSIRDLNKSKEHRTIALKNKSGEVVAFGHITTDIPGNFLQFLRPRADKFPKYGVVTGHCIGANRIIKGFPCHSIVIFQYGVITTT